MTSAPRRLSPARLGGTLAGAVALAALVCAVLPLVGVDHGPNGPTVAWMDLEALWRGEAGPERDILFLSRVPRMVAGVLAGAGLAAAGCAFQALLRNPLAEPYTLGVSSGASLGAVLAIRLGVDRLLGQSGITVAAFAGSAVAVYLVWRLARVGSSVPAATLLLAGITLAVLCSAATMVVQYTASFYETFKIVRWMMGGLDWIPYRELAQAGTIVLIGVSTLVALGRDLNALAAGPDAAASVGVDVRRVSALAYVAASAIVGAVIAVAGPIGFVGLVVPHAMRALVGPDHRILLPTSIFVGAAFVVACDTVGRIAIAPAQLPVGVVTALVGAPFFLGLLLREKGRSRLWGES